MSDGKGLDLDLELCQGEFRLRVALSAAPGETVVVVGPSGSGKSTLLRAVAGLARPRSGRIEIAGRVVLDRVPSGRRGIDLPPWRRRVGIVFQDFALFPHLTVEQNVLFGLKGRPDARARCREWLKRLEILELADRRPRELSGGQQQRVALARAAAPEGDLLLLDEPFGSLDAATRRSVRGELRRFLELAGRTALVVSHDYLDALTLGHRIVVLEDGELTQAGPREDVLRHPRTPFLAALVGHNVLEGTADRRDPDSGMREVAVGPLVFHVAGGETVPAGPVFLGFGPQEVALFRAEGGERPELSARNQFPAVVREIVPLPDRLRIHLDAGAPLMADVVRPAAAALRLEEGTRVLAAVKATAIEIYY